jgi:hypothetical protein
MRKHLALRSIVVMASVASTSAILGLTASAAHADCITYSDTQTYHVGVPGPWGPNDVNIPAVTDVNPHDCITLVTGG